MALLHVSNVTKRFGGLVAVDDISLEVDKGEIVGLIGPNGAGKTTFVNLLTGTLMSSSGSMYYAGRDITRLGPHHRCRLGMARTFQVPHPFGRMTVLENVMTAALFGASKQRRSIDTAATRAQAILDEVGLGEAAGDLAISLTTAGLKRLELARCLAAEPSLIFLDEPLGGLNQTEVKDALDLIRSLSRAGTTIIFIEHIMQAVMAVSDRVVVLANGAKLAEGTPDQIVDDESVQRAYLGDVGGAVERYAKLRERRSA